MPKKAAPTRRRVGRPPAGPNGEPVSKAARQRLGLRPLANVAIRVPEEFTAKLEATATATRQRQSAVIIASLDAYVAQLPKKEQEAIAALVAIMPAKNRPERLRKQR